jgi:DNA-binding response OmpR family regulator
MGELTILLVDDEELLVESMARFFCRKNFDVLTANGVTEGRKIIKENDIQILITDMRMPDGEGIELIELLRKKSPSSIILCATGFSEEDESTILSKGANAVVGKPFEKKELLEIITKELSS